MKIHSTITSKLIALTLTGLFGLSLMSFSQDKSLLWKISGNGLTQPSYLYGSLHLLCPEDLILTEATKNAVAHAEQIVMEIDMDDPQLPAKMGQLSVNPNNKNISDQFEKEDLEAVNQFFQQHYNTDMSQLGVLRPFTALSMMIPKIMSCPKPASYELTFVELKGDKELVGLETIEEHIGLFDQIPIEEQINWIADFAKDPEAQQEDLNALLAHYKANDIEGLYNEFIKAPQFKEFGDILLYNRNADWISKISKLIEEKSSFISVGAGHLASDRGVITLLRKEGYTVTAVN